MYFIDVNGKAFNNVTLYSNDVKFLNMKNIIFIITLSYGSFNVIIERNYNTNDLKENMNAIGKITNVFNDIINNLNNKESILTSEQINYFLNACKTQDNTHINNIVFNVN